MREQGGEIGVGVLVIDNKAGIDRDAAGIDSVAVAAKPWFGLEQRYRMAAGQQPRGGQPRNAPTHYRDR